MEQQGHGPSASGGPHMDDEKLYCILDLRCNEHSRMGTGEFYVGRRSLVVCRRARDRLQILMYRALRRQALPAIAVGHVIISVVMVLNGTVGARLHVAFPGKNIVSH